MLIWIGFSLSIVALLYISRRSIWLAMTTAAVLLAVFTLSVNDMVTALARTFTDPSVLLIAFVVGVIPLIGGALEQSGGMDRLVSNMRMKKRAFFAVSPALLGLLPMPGGALLSAPLIERGGKGVPADVKAAGNVWFRHAFLLVYPLGSSLIASTKIASVSLYQAILFLFPAFVLTIGIGYFLILGGVSGKMTYEENFSLSGLMVPLGIILVAPVIDIIMKSTLQLSPPEIGTAVGVSVSLLLAMGSGGIGSSKLFSIAKKMKPWKYSLIILAMFLFLNVFTLSGSPEMLGSLNVPPMVLCVAIGFILGLITGRIETPIAIVIPIFLIAHGDVSLPVFAVTYFSIYLGYLISPVHPCVSVSLEYFSVPMSHFLRRMAIPVIIAGLADLVVAILVM
jgi:integral membrane protein (TIGR00529 family)